MTLLILSFVAGVLTAAAPCILPLLPVIVGGTLTAEGKTQKLIWYRPLVVVGSLAASIVLFTLLLKATTALLGVPQSAWNIISGIIVATLGLSLLFPTLWEKLVLTLRFNLTSNELLSKSNRQSGLARDILVGASLGPVFSSCSPTYALIVAAVLPVSFAKGLSYLIAYAIGLAAILLLVTLAGQAVVRRLGWLSNPAGWFRRAVGMVFILVGLAVLFGWDRDLQSYILERGWYDPVGELEQRLML